MDKLFGWICRHKMLSLLVVVGLFFIPLIIVHFLFKWNSGLNWLSSEWSAGDVLGYITGFEAFLGTVALGALALWQNKKLEKLSKKSNQVNQINKIIEYEYQKVEGIEKKVKIFRETTDIMKIYLLLNDNITTIYTDDCKKQIVINQLNTIYLEAIEISKQLCKDITTGALVELRSQMIYEISDFTKKFTTCLNEIKNAIHTASQLTDVPENIESIRNSHLKILTNIDEYIIDYRLSINYITYQDVPLWYVKKLFYNLEPIKEQKNHQ